MEHATKPRVGDLDVVPISEVVLESLVIVEGTHQAQFVEVGTQRIEGTQKT